MHFNELAGSDFLERGRPAVFVAFGFEPTTSFDRLATCECSTHLSYALNGPARLTQAIHEQCRARQTPTRPSKSKAGESAGSESAHESFFAAATTLSALMPSSFMTVPPGAERPKRSMPTATPSRPM